MRAEVVLSIATVALALTLQGCGSSATTTTKAPIATTPAATPTTLAKATTTAAPTTTVTTTTTQGFSDACLCLFDVDRTLTGWHQQNDCAKNEKQGGDTDDAYGNGPLYFSEGFLGLEKTPCSKCHLGIITRGDASGPGSKERKDITTLMKTKGTLDSEEWTGPYAPEYEKGKKPLTSPIVWSCLDTFKQDCAKDILTWFKTEKKINFDMKNVTHFDDRQDNVDGFKGTGMNARQVSCATRADSSVGKCGMTPEEIVLEEGVHICPALKARVEIV